VATAAAHGPDTPGTSLVRHIVEDDGRTRRTVVLLAAVTGALAVLLAVVAVAAALLGPMAAAVAGGTPLGAAAALGARARQRRRSP